MLFGGADQSLVVNGEAPVVRMTDDLDCRIFHGTEVSRCVLRHGSAVIAWFMDAGNGVVQTVEVACKGQPMACSAQSGGHKCREGFVAGDGLESVFAENTARFPTKNRIVVT